jgi:hypothetical protein
MPWKFWRELKLWHEVRIGRLFAYVLVLLALTYATFAIRHGVIVFDSWKRLRTPMAMPFAINSNGMNTRVRMQCWLDAPWWSGVGMAIVWPWAETSIGPINPTPAEIQTFQSAYPAGATATPIVRLGAPSPRSVLRQYEDHLKAIAGLMAFPLIMTIAGTLILLALPVTFRQAKIRGVHVARMGLYCLAIPLVCTMWLLWIAPRSNLAWRETIWLDVNPATVVSQLLTPLFTFVWWLHAVRWYLRIPHGLGVVISMSIVGLLVALIVDIVCFNFD